MSVKGPGRDAYPFHLFWHILQRDPLILYLVGPCENNETGKNVSRTPFPSCCVVQFLHISFLLWGEKKKPHIRSYIMSSYFLRTFQLKNWINTKSFHDTHILQDYKYGINFNRFRWGTIYESLQTTNIFFNSILGNQTSLLQENVSWWRMKLLIFMVLPVQLSWKLPV